MDFGICNVHDARYDSLRLYGKGPRPKNIVKQFDQADKL